MLVGATLSQYFMLAGTNAAANWQILVISVLHMLLIQYRTASHTANVTWHCIPQRLANSTCCLLQHLHDSMESHLGYCQVDKKLNK